MGAWEDGFAAGYQTGWDKGTRWAGKPSGVTREIGRIRASQARKPKRKASARSKKYGRAFKRLAPKFKKKDGSWKKNGFKACVRAAHRAAKK